MSNSNLITHTDVITIQQTITTCYDALPHSGRCLIEAGHVIQDNVDSAVQIGILCFLQHMMDKIQETTLITYWPDFIGTVVEATRKDKGIYPYPRALTEYDLETIQTFVYEKCLGLHMATGQRQAHLTGDERALYLQVAVWGIHEFIHHMHRQGANTDVADAWTDLHTEWLYAYERTHHTRIPK